MSEILKNRLEDICPLQRVDELSSTELDNAIDIAFEIIGYNPKFLETSKEYVRDTSNAVQLWEYIYDVWEADQ